MNDREEKMARLLDAWMSNPTDMAFMESRMRRRGLETRKQVEFAKLPPPDPARLEASEAGVLLDTETTGLEQGKDKVIQLAMRKIRFDAEGIISVGEIYNELNDPGMPIPEIVTKLTKITDDDVKGKTISEQAVADFIGETKTVYCHNAKFDRQMVEFNLPHAGFTRLNFHCTADQIDWQARGFNGRSLENIANKCGYTYGAHNALNDINVMPFVLQHEHTGLTAFAEMLGTGRRDKIMICAIESAYETRGLLSARGYRWSPDGLDAAGNMKCWFRILDDDPAILAEEAEFLKDRIFLQDINLPAYRIPADVRYSSRKPTEKVVFASKMIENYSDYIETRPKVKGLQISFGF